eukprot:6704620-Pyramimonas_sp.AAC.1
MSCGAGGACRRNTVRALDEEPLTEESRAWKPAERKGRPGHGHHRHTPQIRNPPEPDAAWA